MFLSSPAFSPNARLIAAERLIGSKDSSRHATEIVVADRRGAVVARLAESEGFIRPVWSPDGRYVFAVSYGFPEAIGRWDWPGGTRAIVPARNASLERGIVQKITFSPSGGRAALLEYQFNRIHVAKVEHDEVSVERALSLPFTYVSFAAWLDEDRFLVAARTTRGQSAGLWEVDANSNAVRRIEMPDMGVRDWVAVHRTEIRPLLPHRVSTGFLGGASGM